MSMPSYACQVCGLQASEDMNLKIDEYVYQDWCVHRMHFIGSCLEVLTCTVCSKLTLDQIFDGYRKRIREGYVVEFH